GLNGLGSTTICTGPLDRRSYGCHKILLWVRFSATHMKTQPVKSQQLSKHSTQSSRLSLRTPNSTATGLADSSMYKGRLKQKVRQCETQYCSISRNLFPAADQPRLRSRR